MMCPFCGQAELKPAVRGMPFTYLGRTTVITDVTGDYCEACGEMILADGEAERVGATMRNFQQMVEAQSIETAPNR